LNTDELAARLQTNIAGFARITGVSRATLNSWRASKDKPYSATVRWDTLLRMADNLEAHSGEAADVVAELRAEAERRRTAQRVQDQGEVVEVTFKPASDAPSKTFTATVEPIMGKRAAQAIASQAVRDVSSVEPYTKEAQTRRRRRSKR
jgi:hypothetical protein